MIRAARALGVSLLSLAAGCGAYRPARFADLPVVTEISDRKPTAVPEPHDPGEIARLTESLVRRPVRSALDPRHDPPAGDVNAFASLAEVVLLEDPGARELLVEAPEDVLRRAVESLAGWDVVRERGARAGESRRRAGRTDD